MSGPSLAIALTGHTAGVTALALAPDGTLLLSGSADGALFAWTPATGELRGTWRGHTATVWALAFNATCSLAFSGSADKTVRVWRTGDGICAAVLSGAHGRDVLHLALPVPQVVVSAGADGRLALWDASMRATSSETAPLPLATARAHGGACRDVARDARRLPGIFFTCGADGGVRAFRCAQRQANAPWQCLPLVECRQACGVECTALVLHCTTSTGAPPMCTLYASSVDGTVTAWRLHTSRGLAALTCVPLCMLELGTEPVRRLALSADGRTLFGARTDGTICVWRGTSSADDKGAHTCRLGSCLQPSHQGPVRCLALSPDGELLYSAGMDGIVRQWSAASGSCVATLDGCHTGAVNAAVLSASGAALFTGSADRSVCVFQVAAPRPRTQVMGVPVVPPPPPPPALVEAAERVEATRRHMATALTGALGALAQAPRRPPWGPLSAILPGLAAAGARGQPQQQQQQEGPHNDSPHWHPRSAP